MKKKICGIVAAIMSAAMFLSGCSLNKMTLDDVKTASLAKVDEMFKVTDGKDFNSADMTFSVELSKDLLDKLADGIESQDPEYTMYTQYIRNLPKLGAEIAVSAVQQGDNSDGSLGLKISALSDLAAKLDFTVVDDNLYFSIQDYGKTTAMLKNAKELMEEKGGNIVDIDVNTGDPETLDALHTLVRDIVGVCNDSMTDKNTVYVTKDVTMSVGAIEVEASKFVTTLEQDAVKSSIESILSKVGDNAKIREALKSDDEEDGGDNYDDLCEGFRKMGEMSTGAESTVYVIDEAVVGYSFRLLGDGDDILSVAMTSYEKDGTYWYEYSLNSINGYEHPDERANMTFVIDATPDSDKADNVHIKYDVSAINDEGEPVAKSGTFPLYNVDIKALSDGLLRGTIKLNGETCGKEWTDEWAEIKDEFGIDVGLVIDVYMETADDVKITITLMDGDSEFCSASMKIKLGVNNEAITAPTENVQAYDNVDEYWETFDYEALIVDALSAFGLQDLLGGYDDSYGGYGGDDAYTYDYGDDVGITDDWYADLYGDTSSDDDWFAELYS